MFIHPLERINVPDFDAEKVSTFRRPHRVPLLCLSLWPVEIKDTRLVDKRNIEIVLANWGDQYQIIT